MRQLIGITLVLLFFFGIGCKSSSEWATKIVWNDIDRSTTPQHEEFSGAPAVMLLNEGKIEIFALSENRFSVLDRHVVIKIFNRRGYKYANIMIPYEPKSAVESIEARTISSSGEITVLNPHKIFDVNLYPDFVFYSDQRAKIFTLPAIEDGCIIEYRYSLTINSSTYGNVWRFQYDIPVLISRFTLLKPAEWKAEFRAYETEVEPEIVEAPAGFKTSMKWELRDVPALKNEIAMPPAQESGARLRFPSVFLRSWSEISDWYEDLMRPQLNQRGDLQALALEITSGIEHDEDKLRALFEWTRDHIRYIAVSIGIGGYQPNPVNDIVINKYGDCKDMTTLLCALAEEADLPVYPALISTKNNGVPDTSLPSITQFNHIIAYCPAVGDRGIWMDATDKTCLFGNLPWYDQGLPVLLIDPAQPGEIVFTPKASAESNQSEITWQVQLDSNGAAAITGEARYSGATANEIRQMLYFASDEEIRRWLEYNLIERCIAIDLDTFSLTGLNPVADPLVIRYNFKTDFMAQVYQNRMTLQPARLADFDLPDFFPSSKRIHPLVFRFPSVASMQMHVELPRGWEVESGIFSDTLRSEYGNAVWDIRHSGGSLKTSCTYLLQAEFIPAADYIDFKSFLDGVRQRDQRMVIFTKSK